MGEILDSGPVAYGLDTGIWTSPMIAWVIEQESAFSIIPATCANCLTVGDFQCNGRAAAGPCRRCSAGPMAPPHLSRP